MERELRRRAPLPDEISPERLRGLGALAEAIGAIYKLCRIHFDAPKVFHGLKKSGVRTSRNRVARIMRENGWAGTTRDCARRPTGEAKQAALQPCAAPDLVRRDFAANRQDRV